MSIDFVAFAIILLLMSPYAVELSVWIGVRGWGCPISRRVILVGTAVFALRKSAPNSALAADDITVRMICEMLSTAPLLGGFSLLFERKWWPPARLLALFSER